MTHPAVDPAHELRERAAARCPVRADLNAAPGNPLVLVPGQALVSTGTFHPVGLATA